MRILIVSDTHGVLAGFKEAVRRVQPDLVLHAGDAEGQEAGIRRLAGCPVEIVRGNCDHASELPKEKIVEAAGHRILLVHGHEHHVKYGEETLALLARERNCGIAVYGHTHVPGVRSEAGITMVNPGSLSLPRQEGHHPTFVVGSTDSAGRIAFKIMSL